MATTTNLDTLKINYLTQAQYDTALSNNQINSNELYFTPDNISGKVIQNVIASDDANSYPVLLSASTDGATATTETALKCGSFTFIRDDNGANALKIGAGRVVLGRVHYNSNETTQREGTGIGIGTGDTSDSEMYYRTAGSGQFVMQHWTAAKKSDTTPADGSYRDSIITMSTAANNPTLYLYNKSSADNITSYSRLNASQLYINDGTDHTLNAADMDKIHQIGNSYVKNVAKDNMASSSNVTNITSFSITAVGMWLVTVSATWSSNASGRRVIGLSKTSGSLYSWENEPYLYARYTANVAPVSGAITTATFSVPIYNTAYTTYYIGSYQNSGSALNLHVSCTYTFMGNGSAVPNG